MKVTLLHVLQWTILFCLACSSDGKTAKKKGGKEGTRPINTVENHKLQPLKYLGTFRDNRYYASTASASWEQAERDCQEVYGKKGSLLSIETEEENQALKKFLSHFGGASHYWTGGRYQQTENVYIWSSTGEELNVDKWTTNPWGRGEPTSTPILHTRTLLYYEDTAYPRWETESSSVLMRYICERQNNNTEPIDP